MQPHDLMLPPRDPAALVEETWHELGKVIRPIGPRLYVRTWKIPDRVGHIYLPVAAQRFYKGLPHSKLVRATVLAAPKGSPFKPGEAVCFPQTFFARLTYALDNTLIGFLHPKYVHGTLVLDAADTEFARQIEEGVACAA